MASESSAMAATAETREQARQILALLPPLRHWITARVQLAGADLDLSVRQYAALRGIGEGAASPVELARLWRVTPAVITGIVDRLEKRGLVRRESDPHDRRRQRLALTETGRAASEDVERALANDLATQLGAASPAELDALGQAIALLHRTFAALEARTPGLTVCCTEDDLPVWSEDDGPATGPPLDLDAGTPPAPTIGARA